MNYQEQYQAELEECEYSQCDLCEWWGHNRELILVGQLYLCPRCAKEIEIDLLQREYWLEEEYHKAMRTEDILIDIDWEDLP
jgi:hypothetical protein